MGDIKKLKKKYNTPAHPWSEKDIEENKLLKKGYGLTNRREILKAKTFLKKYKDIAKRLTAKKTAQGEKEATQVLTKLFELGILPHGSKLDTILGLEIKDVLERRLQSLVCRKGFSRTMRQARQFITHRHVKIENREITSPSYLVTLKEEALITFKEKSPLASEDHPERVNLVASVKEEIENLKKGMDEAKDKEDKESSVKRPKADKKEKFGEKQDKPASKPKKAPFKKDNSEEKQ
jgi:small subunit ribosomal protein S4